MKYVIAVLVLLGLTGFLIEQYWPQAILQIFVPGKQETVARSYIEDFRRQNYGPIEANLAEIFRTPDLPARLSATGKYVPNENPKSVKLVGSHVFSGSDFANYNFLFEYEFRHRWLLFNVILNEKAAVTRITRFYVREIPKSLEEQNAFVLTGKSSTSYGILAAAVIVALFTIGSAIFCGFFRPPGRKWPWIIFCLFGITQFSLNWVTGGTALHLWSVNLPAGNYIQELYGPPIISVGFPLGAIIFWIRYLHWRYEMRNAGPDLRST